MYNVINVSECSAYEDDLDDLDIFDSLIEKDETESDATLALVSEVVQGNWSQLELKVMSSLIDSKTYRDAAKQAGCSEKTVGRYMADQRFVNEFNRIGRLLLIDRKVVQVHKALISTATGKDRAGKVAAINTYYRLTGMIKPDSINVNNNNVNNNNVYGNETIPLDKLPVWLKLVIVSVVTGQDIPKPLQDEIINQLGSNIGTVNQTCDNNGDLTITEYEHLPLLDQYRPDTPDETETESTF